jgi:hypothetical protein
MGYPRGEFAITRTKGNNKMGRQWSREKESVAYHEAGHWVMAYVEKAPLWDIHLLWNKIENAWEGKVHGYSRSLGGPTGIMIAYAGPLAEIKYQARLQLKSTALFDTTSEPADLIRYLQNPDSEDTESMTDPWVKFLVSKQETPLQIDLNSFSYDDTMAFQLAKGDGVLIKDLLVKARDRLDNVLVWSAVETLAHKLLDCLADGDRATLLGPDAKLAIEGILIPE